ncbi:hypothetical protein HDU97_002749 [Phlyctochytrium planicorne]|nr:hypothetical protein HDU97_002749 [Phlyctochytrium planicorne]
MAMSIINEDDDVFIRAAIAATTKQLSIIKAKKENEELDAKETSQLQKQLTSDFDVLPRSDKAIVSAEGLLKNGIQARHLEMFNTKAILPNGGIASSLSCISIDEFSCLEWEIRKMERMRQ